MNGPDLHERYGMMLSPEIDHSLPGGSVVVGTFENPEIQNYPEMDFCAHPGQAVDQELGIGLQEMLGVVQRRYPHHRIDVSVRRETFQAGVPESFATHKFGIHRDEFDDGFFVFSTDEPTTFYDENRNNAKPALPGELVYVPGYALHSAPNPKHDGERVRIKLIPRVPYVDVRETINELIG